MKYRVLPIEGTPFWLFGILFFLCGFHIAISLYPQVLGVWKKYLDRIKLWAIIATLAISIGAPVLTAMVDRAKVAPVWGVHDIILQQEAAMRYLIVHKNPYKETYFGTPVESFNYDEVGNDNAVNPALYHFVMPPWYLIFPFAFYYTVRPVVGFFDGRMALLFTYIVLLWGVWEWFADKRIARIALVLTAASPFVVDYFIEGRSDVFALSWFMVSLVFLTKKKYSLSSVFFALAIMSKQTIWFAAPFYLLLLVRQLGWKTRQFWSQAGIVAGVSALLCAPFVLWDWRAFIDSTILYLSGNAPHSYPVGGYGLGMTLYELGFIRDIHAYYPFVIWQILLGVPVLIVFMRFLWRHPKQSVMMSGYAFFLLVFWYVSRYFNNSHLGYLSMLFVLGGLKQADEERV
jgi:uncharacterized membrane protein